VPMRTTATFDTLGLVLGATVEIVQTIRRDEGVHPCCPSAGSCSGYSGRYLISDGFCRRDAATGKPARHRTLMRAKADGPIRP